jgi:hypothetical protein
MTPEQLRAYCLAKPGARPDEPDEWLARYPRDASVIPCIGRSGWNTLRVGGAIPDDELPRAGPTLRLGFDLTIPGGTSRPG